MSERKFDTKWGERTYARLFCSQLTRGQTMMIARFLGDDSRYVKYSEDAYELMQAVIETQPRVLPDSFARGVQQLRTLFFTPKGEFRDTQLTQKTPVTPHDRNVARNASHIDLIDFQDQWNGDRMLTVFDPVYRIYGYRTDPTRQTQYAWFDYVMPSWQSKRAFEILSRGIS